MWSLRIVTEYNILWRNFPTENDARKFVEDIFLKNHGLWFTEITETQSFGGFPTFVPDRYMRWIELHNHPAP